MAIACPFFYSDLFPDKTDKREHKYASERVLLGNVRPRVLIRRIIFLSVFLAPSDFRGLSTLQEFLQVFDVWQGVTELLRHFLLRAVGGHAHRLVVVFDEVLNNGFVGALAQDQADGGILVRLADKVIQDGQITVQLAQICGLEGSSFQFHGHECV